MIQFLYRRIINNKWLFICLLTGVMFACGIFASVPMYSSAILQKVLTKDLESYHAQTGISPGAYSVIIKEQAGNDPDTSLKIEDIVKRQLISAFGLPIEKNVRQVTCASLRLMREGDEAFNDKRMYAQMVSLKDYGEHIKILKGKLPEGTSQNGIYEAAVSEEALGRMSLLLDNVYILASVRNNINPPEIIKFKITGVFTVQDKNELYWSGGRYDRLKNSLVFYDGILEKLAYDIDELKVESIDNTYFFDYRTIKIGEAKIINEIFQGQLRWNVKNGSLTEIKLPMVEVLNSYGQREKQLGITLWILTIPLMIIICFYTLMISALIIRNDRNEIAILKSRGAGRLQIFLLYVLESAAVAGIAFVSGPYIAYGICSLLGASNGFLEFVSRKALPLSINAHAFLYSLIGAALFLIFMLVPALKASAKGIVHHKRSLAAETEKPLWKRFYLDILVMGISLYGLYSFKNRQNLLNIAGIEGTDLGVDPLLFFISTFFILGASLVFLRIYPLIMKLVFQLGVRWWNPVLYFSLVNVSRADKNQQSIMLFIILALSFGIINSSQARTINSNVVDRIMYNNGADVVIEPYNNLKHLSRSSFNQTGSGLTASEKYKEPNYQEYSSIEGVESMTKVFVENDATLTNGVERTANVKLMGIIPHEFGRTVWFRRDLLPYHINEYLNLLAGAQRAALLSSSLKDKYKKGDNISIDWGKGNLIECTVYGFIDYFPSYNPYIKKNDEEGRKQDSKKDLVVINYNYMIKKLPVQPYEIWLKKKEGTSDSEINKALEERNLSVERVDYSMQEIIKSKNDPVLLGTNGVFTMCFLITMLIAAAGFIVFWVLSIKDRSLKFGIFRAMGMPMRSVTLIMICEQLLVSGVAIVTGILLGSAASKLFIPLLQLVHSSSQMVPPFRIIAYSSDYIKVISVTVIMLVTAITFLYWLVRKINIHQVLKLGED